MRLPLRRIRPQRHSMLRAESQVTTTTTRLKDSRNSKSTAKLQDRPSAAAVDEAVRTPPSPKDTGAAQQTSTSAPTQSVPSSISGSCERRLCSSYHLSLSRISSVEGMEMAATSFNDPSNVGEDSRRGETRCGEWCMIILLNDVTYV